MNSYLLALISVIAAFIVGFVIYGQIYQGPLETKGEKIDPTHLFVTAVLVFLSSLSFIYLFDHVSMDSTGVTKGVILGLLIGLGFFAFPLIADGGFFKAKKEALTAVSLNWVLSFVVIGLVVGWLR
jgi:ABC-type sugar transport system permease subunit